MSGMKTPVIEFDSVTKRYGKARGVEYVTLTVKPGVVFGFLGPNGAGKSTAIHMMLDYIRPTSGKVRLFGLDAKLDAVEVHRRVGFLAGDMAMDGGLTGSQQLEYLAHLRGGVDRKYLAALSKRLDCRLDRKFKTLSRGNKQKIGLIAALMHRPELLILDEPTSGLDPLMQVEFNKIIAEHKASGGTVFVSSHVLSEIQEICDEVTFIREGKVIATRPVSQIAKDSPQKLVVRTNSKDLQSKLKKFSGFTVQVSSDGVLQGLFSGDVNKLLRLVSGYSVQQFSLSEADLESVFMQYYEDPDA